MAFHCGRKTHPRQRWKSTSTETENSFPCATRPIQRIYNLDIYDEGIPKLVRTSAKVAQEGQMTAASKEKEDNVEIRADEQTRSSRKVKPLFTISHVIMDFGCGADHSAAVSTSDHFTYF